MLKDIYLVLVIIGFNSIRKDEALRCYQCFASNQSDKIECNQNAVTSLNKAVEPIFHPVSPAHGDEFDCITLAYLDGDEHAKFQGCIYDSDYTCSLRPRNLTTAFVCGTCKGDYCNSSRASISRVKIVFSLLSTFVAAAVASLL